MRGEMITDRMRSILRTFFFLILVTGLPGCSSSLTRLPENPMNFTINPGRTVVVVSNNYDENDTDLSNTITSAAAEAIDTHMAAPPQVVDYLAPGAVFEIVTGLMEKGLVAYGKEKQLDNIKDLSAKAGEYDALILLDIRTSSAILGLSDFVEYRAAYYDNTRNRFRSVVFRKSPIPGIQDGKGMLHYGIEDIFRDLLGQPDP